MFLYLENFEDILTIQDSLRSPGPRGQTKALYGGDGHAPSHEPNIPHPSPRQSSTIFEGGSQLPAPVSTYELDNKYRKDPPADSAEINMPSAPNRGPTPPGFLERTLALLSTSFNFKNRQEILGIHYLVQRAQHYRNETLWVGARFSLNFRVTEELRPSTSILMCLFPPTHHLHS
jgi:hypothetical protein